MNDAEPLRLRGSGFFGDTLSSATNIVRTNDRNVPIIAALASPQLFIFAQLFDEVECDGLMKLSMSRMEPSTVADKGGLYSQDAARTSSGVKLKRCENDLIVKLERRVSELLNYPEENMEPFQVLRYRPGEEYKPHQDYFNPSVEDNKTYLANGGQRLATLIIYLNDVPAGGSTNFPKIGLNVMPKRGDAVLFSYLTEDQRVDPRLQHAGSPVLSGEKWIATKWLRQMEYRPGGTGAQNMAESGC